MSDRQIQAGALLFLLLMVLVARSGQAMDNQPVMPARTPIPTIAPALPTPCPLLPTQPALSGAEG